MPTLADLTRQTARLVTRTVIGSATALGTTSTLVDTNNLANFPDDQFNGGTLWLTSGANAGLSRAITDFVAATKSLTFAVFPSAVASGVTFEAADSHLFTYQDLKQAVNLALREIGMIVTSPNETVVTDGNQDYSLPAGVSHVCEVWVVTNIGTSNETSYPSHHWREQDGKLKFDQSLSGPTLRIYYEVFHSELTGDTDALDSQVDETYLVYLCARQALRLAYKRYGNQKEELPTWLQDAATEAQRHFERNRKNLVKMRSA